MSSEGGMHVADPWKAWGEIKDAPSDDEYPDLPRVSPVQYNWNPAFSLPAEPGTLGRLPSFGYGREIVAGLRAMRRLGRWQRARDKVRGVVKMVKDKVRGFTRRQ